MKKFALTVLVFGLMGGFAAYAQPKDDHHGQAAGSAHPSHAPSPAPHRTMSDHGHPGGDNAHSSPTRGRPTPAVSMRGRPAGNPSGSGATTGRHHLPPGITAPRTHDHAPIWRGRSWGIGDFFILTGFQGPVIYDTGSYGLSLPRPGTHWIYVDGFFLMVGNRTGRIFAEVPADY